MSTNNTTGLRRAAVSWYTSTLATIVVLGGFVFLVLVLGVGPTGLLTAFGLSLTVAFVTLFVSLATGSDLVYRLLGGD